MIVHGGRVIDGAGNPWIAADIGIANGRIVAIGDLSAARAGNRIDATGKVVAPGFIDMMGQDTLSYVTQRGVAESRLRQGITTHLSGEGWSHAPQTSTTQPQGELVAGERVRWQTFAQYFQLLERHRIAVNVVHNVGAAQVRRAVMGEAARAPTTKEMDAMKALVDQAMRDGAVGLSSALIYPPGSYASTEELIELSKVAARHRGIYLTHMRNESAALLDSIEETLRIGREAQLPVHIYHLKAAGQQSWPLMAAAIAKIDAARAAGLDVTADTYPYTRNGIRIRAFISPDRYRDPGFVASLRDPSVQQAVRREIESGDGDWENWYVHVGRDWDKVLIAEAGSFTRVPVVGLSLAAAARQAGVDVWDLFFELAAANDVRVAPESMNEAQKRLAFEAPWLMVETDSPPTDPKVTRSVHPRAFGAFPRVLAKYVREDGVLTLEDAIRRMTSLPASRLGLRDRGLLAVGMAADVVVFDPAKIADKATFAEPTQFAEGVEQLLVNGVAVIRDSKLTGELPGKVIRSQASATN